MSAIYFSFTTRTTQRHDPRARITRRLPMYPIQLVILAVLALLLGALLLWLALRLLG
jgi:hypothetical protein